MARARRDIHQGDARTGSRPPGIPVRRAAASDAEEVARLLHAFHTEVGYPTPGASVLAGRVRRLIEAGEMTALLGGDGPDGLADLRYRASVWTGALDAYIEEIYVIPERRRRGIGRALLGDAMEVARGAGATVILVATSEDDAPAIDLYERAGFTDREGGPDGPRTRFYEREL